MDKRRIPNHILMSEVRRLISEGQSVVLRVKGNSMLPFIRGDKDSVKLVPVGRLKVGDIILAEVSPGVFYLHRLVETDDNRLVMMGDGNLGQREFIRYSDVIGQVVRIIHEDGTETDCCTARERRKAAWWYRLLPVRRWLLAFWKLCYLS